MGLNREGKIDTPNGHICAKSVLVTIRDNNLCDKFIANRQLGMPGRC